MRWVLLSIVRSVQQKTEKIVISCSKDVAWHEIKSDTENKDKKYKLCAT